MAGMEQLIAFRNNINCDGLLVDLTGHGKSKERLLKVEDLGIDDCIYDLSGTLQAALAEEKSSVASDSVSIMGHSLGGRVAVMYAVAASTNHMTPSVDRLWLLDTVPGQADSSVAHVINSVSQIVNGDRTWTRDTLVKELHEVRKIELPVAQWLAVSFQEKEQVFNFDVEAAHDLLIDIPNHDLIADLTRLLEHGKDGEHAVNRIDLICGGLNKAWETMGHLVTLQSLEKAHPSRFAIHVLPKAGHWVHFDDLHGLLHAVGTD